MSKRKSKLGLNSLLPLTPPPAPKRQTPKKNLPPFLTEPTIIVGDAKELNDYLPGRSYHGCFGSLESWIRHIDSLDRSKAWDPCGWDSSGAYNANFYGTNSMEEALKLGKEGWKDGAEAVERARAKIKSLRPTRTKNIKYNMVGAIPCVPRAVAGNLLNMREPASALSKKRPVLTIISNMSCLGGVEQKAMTNRAAVVATLIDEIEASGFACEIITSAMSYACSNRSFRMCHSIMLKRSDQPVDLFRMAFGLGHASMFRRMVFADRGSSKVIQPHSGWGIGSSHGFEDFDEEFLKSKDVFTLPSANLCEEKFRDEETAATEGIAYLIHELRKQKCPAFPKFTVEELRQQDLAEAA